MYQITPTTNDGSPDAYVLMAAYSPGTLFPTVERMQHVQTTPTPRSFVSRLVNAYTVRFGRELLYLAAVCIVGMAGCLAYSALGLATGLAALTLVGIPVIYAFIMSFRASSWLIRWVNAIYTWSKPQHLPRYDLVPNTDERRRRIVASLKNPQTWMDLLGTIFFSLAGVGYSIVAVYVILLYTALPYAVWESATRANIDYVNQYPVYIFEAFGHEITLHKHDEMQIYVTALVFQLLITPWVARLFAWLFFHSTDFVLNRFLLHRQEVSRIKASRTKARAAASETYRRLERNIHDGPQQDLVRLGMDLGRARRHIGSDDALATELIDDAASRTSQILTDLRDLSRGIAPPILSDRGLHAATREIAARSAVPCTVTYSVDNDIPYFTEETVYFACSEAMANVNKHSRATDANITIRQDGDGVVATISDNGQGGAHESKGSGLIGLRQRVEAADGTLTILSPSGGPTTLEVNVPCEW